MTDNYTLIAYRRNSSDRVKGNILTYYSSDFQIFYSQHPQQIANEEAKLVARILDDNAEPYQITILINGIDPPSYEQSYWADQEEERLYKLYKELQILRMHAIYKERARVKAEVERLEAIKKAAAEANERKRDEADFERLKTKLGK